MLKNVNQLIKDYTGHLQQGEIQAAYKVILEFIGKLRSDFIKKYPDNNIGNMYQGYMDMTYFSLTTESLKDKGLKIAIVYLHEKGAFEVWLSARNRDTAKKYEAIINSDISDEINVFHDKANRDAIIECTLTATPNFEDQALLTAIIDQGVKKFVQAVSSHI
ncbi:MAG TPA: hypothetical protein VK947_03405 [Planococcus sp. (in: firmicutes)]|nr:hypothetical protein [Planococcus sp. (in: firmicutes)]